MRFKDLSGQKFGNLTVLNITERKYSKNKKRQYWYYLCLCDCGKTREVKGQNLTQGNSKSCGCIKPMISQAHTLTDYKQLEGKTFGKLKVLERDFENLGKGTHCYYKCICKCGKEKIINSHDLQKSKSCGCLKKEWMYNGFKQKYCQKKQIL